MSDEDLQEKTEDPSERRKRESRAKGMIVRSKELTNLFILLGSVLLLKSYAKTLSKDFKSIFHGSLSFSPDAFKDEYYIVKYFKEVIVQASLSIFPILIFCLIFIVAGGSVVGGLHLNFQAMGVKFDRLNPLAGLKKMFSRNTVMELIKSLAKFLLLALSFYAIIKSTLPQIIKLDEVDVFAGIDIAINLFLFVSLLICLPLIIVALIDVPYQQWNLNQMLKMTKQEVREESKESDVSPEVKSRIRKLQMELSKRKMMKDVPNADVIITNPEHFAVALKYDETKNGAPIVVAKGLDFMAEIIKKIANSSSVPIVEAPAVARSLYYNVELGAEIPTGLYIAVAKILTYIHELNLYKKGKMNKPKLKTDFQIPSELVR